MWEFTDQEIQTTTTHLRDLIDRMEWANALTKAPPPATRREELLALKSVQLHFQSEAQRRARYQPKFRGFNS